MPTPQALRITLLVGAGFSCLSSILLIVTGALVAYFGSSCNQTYSQLNGDYIYDYPTDNSKYPAGTATAFLAALGSVIAIVLSLKISGRMARIQSDSFLQSRVSKMPIVLCCIAVLINVAAGLSYHFMDIADFVNTGSGGNYCISDDDSLDDSRKQYTYPSSLFVAAVAMTIISALLSICNGTFSHIVLKTSAKNQTQTYVASVQSTTLTGYNSTQTVPAMTVANTPVALAYVVQSSTFYPSNTNEVQGDPAGIPSQTTTYDPRSRNSEAPTGWSVVA